MLLNTFRHTSVHPRGKTRSDLTCVILSPSRLCYLALVLPTTAHHLLGRGTLSRLLRNGEVLSLRKDSDAIDRNVDLKTKSTFASVRALRVLINGIDTADHLQLPVSVISRHVHSFNGSPSCPLTDARAPVHQGAYDHWTSVFCVSLVRTGKNVIRFEVQVLLLAF